MIIFQLINQLVDLIVLPFTGVGPVWGLVIVSLVSAYILLFIFKKISNQNMIRFHKNKIIGCFLEIALFKDQFSRVIKNQGHIFKHNIIYLRYVVTPMLVMALPILLVCLQLEYRLGYRPLSVDEPFTVKALLDTEMTGSNATLADLRIIPTETITVETRPLRIDRDGMVFWRARVTTRANRHTIKFKTDSMPEQVVEKELAVEQPLIRYTPEKSKITSIGDLIINGEEPIQDTSMLKAVHVSYQRAEFSLLGWDLSPVIYYMILTLGFGILLKPFLKVDI